MESVNINFQYSKEQFINAYKLHYKIHLKRERDLVVALVALTLVISLFFFSQPKDSLSTWFLILSIISGIFLLILLTIFNIIPRLIIKKELKLEDQYHLIFSMEGIVFKTKKVDSKLSWELYNKVVEDNNFFLLYYGKTAFTIIPKKEFKDEKDLILFKELTTKFIYSKN